MCPIVAAGQSTVSEPRTAQRAGIIPDESARALSRFDRFAASLVPVGDAVGGFVAAPAVFLLVLSGKIEATASPPGGVLRGPVGAVVSFGLHAFWGVYGAMLVIIAWLGLLLVLFGLLGALRRRGPWYVAPIEAGSGSRRTRAG